MNCGHIIVGIILKFKVQNLKIMPFGFAVSFKIDTKNYNKKILRGNLLVLKKIIVAIAGPLVNIAIIIIVIMLKNQEILSIKTTNIIYANILIFLFNILPIYPLDGGRILKNILHIIFGKIVSLQVINIISIVTSIILSIICVYITLALKNLSYIFVIIYIWIIAIKSVKISNIKIKIYKILKNYIAINKN